MSWLSEAGEKYGPSLLTFGATKSPLAAYGMYQSGIGQPGQTSDNQGSTIGGSESSNARAQQIMKAIQAQSGSGTFGEGQIVAANKELKKLKEDLNAGKISQADFVSISGSIYPQVADYIQKVGGSGSAGADAARNAGGFDLMNDFGRDYNIYKSGQELLGRDLTAQDLAMLRPKFADGTDTGNAYLAEIAKQEKNSPQALAKRAGGFSGDINNTFQTLLSRGATKDEVDYFGRMLASGNVTPYEINQFVQQLPEYQNVQDKNFRSGLDQELGQYDTKAFGRERENIMSQFTKAGIQNSSALDFAITDALGKIQENRGKFLAGLSSQQYGGNKDAARGDYETSLKRMFQGQDYGTQKSDAYLDYLTKRADSGADYSRQRDDYMQFLNSQPRQKTSPFDYLNAGLGAAQVGAQVAPLFF